MQDRVYALDLHIRRRSTGGTVLPRSARTVLCALRNGTLLLCLAGSLLSHAADLYKGVATAVKAPDCITDPSGTFFVDNVPQAQVPHDTLPTGRFYLVVRYLGDAAVSAPVEYDFGRFPDTYPAPELRGVPLTGLSVPAPGSTWQRAQQPDATVDNSSAFQIHCEAAGSFINSWTFPYRELSGEGPHVVYGYNFDSQNRPPAFDDHPATDFAVQASIEIPWLMTWADPETAAPLPPTGQVSMFAYFRDRVTGKLFAFLLDIFDNHYAAAPTYRSYVAHDGETPFVSVPLNRSARYATPYPKSANFTGTTWSGLRLFGARITQDEFGKALGDINAYCATRAELRFCDEVPMIGGAYSPVVTDYDVTSFGLLHEIFGTDDRNHLSMGVHVSGLGVWNFR